MKLSQITPLLLAGASIAMLAPSAHAMTFNLTPTFDPSSGNNLLAYQDFQAAANRWSSYFSDPITVNLTIGFDTNFPSANIIGSTASIQNNYSYTNVTSKLIADAKSADDIAATTHLPTGSQAGSFDLEINETSDNPNGSGSATPYIDSNGGPNNSQVRLTNADAKALGILPGSATANDATITFNSNFAFDYNPSDGIDSDKIDFVGVATHEIGHALGFISGVDILDLNSPYMSQYFPADQFNYVSTLDLFRYSSLSASNHVIDWSDDNRTKYFSIDGGTTSIAAFATGMTHGDGSQASHWKDNLGLGIMDPTFAYGELGVVSQNDLRAFDVIGYDLNTAVPEPTTTAAFGLGTLTLIGLVTLRRRRQSRAS